MINFLRKFSPIKKWLKIFIQINAVNKLIIKKLKDIFIDTESQIKMTDNLKED